MPSAHAKDSLANSVHWSPAFMADRDLVGPFSAMHAANISCAQSWKHVWTNCPFPSPQTRVVMVGVSDPPQGTQGRVFVLETAQSTLWSHQKKLSQVWDRGSERLH